MVGGSLQPDPGTSSTGHPLSVVDRPHWTVGDRLAAFVALLPADPSGPVVLAMSDELSPHVQAALPGAVVLTEDPTAARWPDPGRVVRWDGRTPPVAPASAGLLLLDARRYDASSLGALVAPGGALAVIGPDGPHVLYPSAERPELVWRRSWPVTVPSGPVPWLRRRLGLARSLSPAPLPGRRPPAARLLVTGSPGPSLADAVLADLEATTGVPGRLVGLVTAGHTVLRVRRVDGDVAVRLSQVDPGRESDREDRVRAEVPAADRFLPWVVARGRTRGRPWVATAWTPRPGSGPRWPSPDLQWQVADELVGVLAARVTGMTGPGWAGRWAGSAHVVPPAVRARWAAAMAPLEDGLPTAWCHGDLWPGNVLLDEAGARVIDWDNSSPDAPQGLDRLLVPALRRADDPERLPTSEILRLVDEVDGVEAVVAGRRWAEWERPMRLALALAAVVLHLRNRSFHDLGAETLERHLTAVEAALAPVAAADQGPTAGDPVAQALASGGAEAGRTARGALWLATNGVVVKTSQTVVLLTLAAMLAPSALGLVALGTLVANVSAVVTSLGTASALVYWRGDVRRAARTAVTIGVGMGAALAGLLWVAAPWLARTLRAEAGGADVIRGLTVVLPCLAVAAVTNELLRRELRFLRRIIPDTVSSVVGAAVAIVLVARGQGVMALVVGQVVQATLTMLLAWVVHPPVRPGWSTEDARGLLSYGGPYAGANLLELVQLNVDYLIVARVLGGVALGQYSLAFRLAFMPYLMIVVVTTGAAFPYLCRVRGHDLGRSAVVVMTATLTLVAPLCAGLALFSDHLTLLGSKWGPGVPVVGWLALYAVLLSVGQLVQTALNAAGRPGISMGLRLTHLLLLLAALSLLVRQGITAVAIGQVAAASCVALLALALARVHVAGFSLRRLAASLRPAAVAVLAMSAVVLLVRHALDLTDPSVASLVLLGGLGVLAFAGTVWALDREHLREAVRLMRRPS